MYSRSYNDDHALHIPEGYDGTALLESRDTAQPLAIPTPELPRREVKISPPAEPCEEVSEASARPEKKCADLRLPSFLREIISSRSFGLGLPSLGGEELLIGAIAIFLLLSHGGDSLCAILLLGLLFIT